jgi:hypothetical protein
MTIIEDPANVRWAGHNGLAHFVSVGFGRYKDPGRAYLVQIERLLEETGVSIRIEDDDISAPASVFVEEEEQLGNEAMWGYEPAIPHHGIVKRYENIKDDQPWSKEAEDTRQNDIQMAQVTDQNNGRYMRFEKKLKRQHTIRGEESQGD